MWRRQIVRPSVAECFVKGFLAVHEATHEEKGNLVYSLAKTLTDNLVFYGYSGITQFLPVTRDSTS